MGHFLNVVPGPFQVLATAYKLRVTSKGVEIEAITETGVYRAIQTLRQLTEKKGNGIAITGCEITDWPAFRIRGFMQDVGRTYISTDELNGK